MTLKVKHISNYKSLLWLKQYTRLTFQLHFQNGSQNGHSVTTLCSVLRLVSNESSLIALSVGINNSEWPNSPFVTLSFFFTLLRAGQIIMFLCSFAGVTFINFVFQQRLNVGNTQTHIYTQHTPFAGVCGKNTYP